MASKRKAAEVIDEIDDLDCEPIELTDWIVGIPPVSKSTVAYKVLESPFGVYYTMVPVDTLKAGGVDLQADCPGSRLLSATKSGFPAALCRHNKEPDACMECAII